MIYYFSGTGNSKWIAEQTAIKTQDIAVPIVQYLRSKMNPIIPTDCGTLGFVFPVYGWDVPQIMKDFISKLDIPENTFVFSICTCGDEVGETFNKLQKLIKIDSAYSIQMPNNYIMLFDTDSQSLVDKKIRNAKAALDKICQSINNRKTEIKIHKGSLSAFKTFITSPVFNKIISDKKFYVEPSCIKCGKCAEVCPMENIKLIEGKPTWNGNCINCAACINYCLTEAIQYGNGTFKRERYTIEKALGLNEIRL